MATLYENIDKIESLELKQTVKAQLKMLEEMVNKELDSARDEVLELRKLNDRLMFELERVKNGKFK